MPGEINEQQLADLLISEASGVKVLPSPQELRRRLELSPIHAKTIVKTARIMGEFVVIDLPTGTTHANREALALSDRIILVTEPTPASASATDVMLDVLDSLALSRDKVGIAVVQRCESARQIPVSDLADYFRVKLLGTIPADPEGCFEAERQGRPLVTLSEADPTVIKAFEELTSNLLGQKTDN